MNDAQRKVVFWSLIVVGIPLGFLSGVAVTSEITQLQGWPDRLFAWLPSMGIPLGIALYVRAGGKRVGPITQPR